MNNEEILKKAIEKAIKNGMESVRDAFIFQKWQLKEPYGVMSVQGNWIFKYNDDLEDFLSIYEIIFSHDFAKAFWSEETVKYKIVSTEDNRGFYKGNYIWQIHLQKMVLEEDPIKYLEQFI